MDKIYTIPVNDAFDSENGCPFCRMRERLESDEIGIILGASMMEPDIRILTNKKGFCRKHYGDLLNGQKRLPLALMLESHLNKILTDCVTPTVAVKGKTAAVAEKYAGFSSSCYICDKVEFHLEKMFSTACYLWVNDADFRKKFSSRDGFCLPCFARLLETVVKEIPKKQSTGFLAEAQQIETKYIAGIKDDISWFCKKFDYRYENEPWGNAKDAVERAACLLGGKGTDEL